MIGLRYRLSDILGISANYNLNVVQAPENWRFEFDGAEPEMVNRKGRAEYLEAGSRAVGFKPLNQILFFSQEAHFWS